MLSVLDLSRSTVALLYLVCVLQDLFIPERENLNLLQSLSLSGSPDTVSRNIVLGLYAQLAATLEYKATKLL
jgi:hypothetical protein